MPLTLRLGRTRRHSETLAQPTVTALTRRGSGDRFEANEPPRGRHASQVNRKRPLRVVVADQRPEGRKKARATTRGSKESGGKPGLLLSTRDNEDAFAARPMLRVAGVLRERVIGPAEPSTAREVVGEPALLQARLERPPRRRRRAAPCSCLRNRTDRQDSADQERGCQPRAA